MIVGAGALEASGSKGARVTMRLATASRGSLGRAQAALAERWARPRKLALGSYAFFALAFVSLFPAVAGTALLAVALNGMVTLAGASMLATTERWAPRIASGQVPLLDRTFQLATLLWLYAGGVFLAVSVGARL
jgi:hypothetical protein